MHRFVAPVCLLLVACVWGGSEEAAENAYMEYRKAILAEDLEKLRSLVVAEQADRFGGPGSAIRLARIRASLPEDIVVKERSFADGKATLKLAGMTIMEEGTLETAIPGEGRVELVREGGRWKIAKEDWSFHLDAEFP